MRVLMFDIDTLRSDHLGCYGYGRDTSPTIDAIAAEGVRFDNYYCPHTPYRTPAEFGNPFADQPLPDNWIDQQVFEEHRRHVGPHCANEINMWDDSTYPQFPRHPGSLKDLGDVKLFTDQYDCGVRYTDDNIAQIIGLVKEMGLYDDDLAIIVTADHGENMGELGIYGEHATADEPTCHIPMIIK